MGLNNHGIRNGAQTTIAPTGTIATVAGCEGYGCEPVFALAYIRHVNDNGHDLPLAYTSPQFENALVEAGLTEHERHSIIEQVLESGTCQENDVVPEPIQHVFVVSQDISAEEHVRTQAAMQAFVDNSLSKTVNFPAMVAKTKWLKHICWHGSWDVKALQYMSQGHVKKWSWKPKPLHVKKSLPCMKNTCRWLSNPSAQ